MNTGVKTPSKQYFSVTVLVTQHDGVPCIDSLEENYQFLAMLTAQRPRRTPTQIKDRPRVPAASRCY